MSWRDIGDGVLAVVTAAIWLAVWIGHVQRVRQARSVTRIFGQDVSVRQTTTTPWLVAKDQATGTLYYADRPATEILDALTDADFAKPGPVTRDKLPWPH
jgi:hypothetical protein